MISGTKSSATPIVDEDIRCFLLRAALQAPDAVIIIIIVIIVIVIMIRTGIYTYKQMFQFDFKRFI